MVVAKCAEVRQPSTAVLGDERRLKSTSSCGAEFSDAVQGGRADRTRPHWRPKRVLMSLRESSFGNADVLGFMLPRDPSRGVLIAPSLGWPRLQIQSMVFPLQTQRTIPCFHLMSSKHTTGKDKKNMTRLYAAPGQLGASKNAWSDTTTRQRGILR
jgi:hypothetical protein